ncbi:MAG: tetratricopeptide repeat protein [Acidobacteriaceae bacterium]
MTSFARRALLLSLLCAGARIFLGPTPIAAQQDAKQNTYAASPSPETPTAPETPERKAYADHIRSTYKFPFAANNISLPGNAAVQGNDFLQPSAFPTAAYCGHCHTEAYHQWRQALHSNSFRSPFYRHSVNLLIHEKGAPFARHCDSCHNPIGVVSGSLNPNATGDRSFDNDGVTCMVCHSIQSISNRSGNGSYVIGVPAVLVDADGNRIPGIPSDKEILANLDRHSRAVMQPFYRSAEFCLVCHKANLPVMLDNYKWIRAFDTYDEWQASKFSHQNPLVFYQADFASCQNCHMKRAPLTMQDPGAKNGTFASHSWAAGNTGVPFYYGFTEQLQKTIDFLHANNYLNVDIFGLKASANTPTDDDPLIAPLGATSFRIAPRDTLQLYVVIQNKNIGHSLIPEVRDLFEAWVSLTVTDATGHTLYQSGFLRPDGTIDPSAHSFTNRPVNSEGSFVDNHRVWTLHSVAYDNTIQSGRSALVRYQFHLPANTTGPITIKAAVEYRHFRRTYTNNVLGPNHPAYPIVELASRTRTLNIGDNTPTSPEPNDNATWMRWNNLGIGLLDELQYADAQDAFQHVTHLRPDYADGFTNLGLNDIEWEKYREARAPLEHALALKPNDARALYYLAIVERRESHPETAIADLEQVVQEYPQARDPLRELGISYYQSHRVHDAVATFQALQAVDPDDLTAHYNLAILYHRLGMRKQAAYESAQYAMKYIDPGAPTYSLDYLRKHPELRIESVPWHLHAQTAAPTTEAKAKP